MDFSTIKHCFSIFQPTMAEEYPRMTINMVGGVIINIDNTKDTSISITKENMKIETPKTISIISLDEIIKICIHKK